MENRVILTLVNTSPDYFQVYRELYDDFQAIEALEITKMEAEVHHIFNPRRDDFSNMGIIDTNTGECVGIIGVNYIHNSEGYVHVYIRESFRSLGYCTEALSKLILFFKDLTVKYFDRLVIETKELNLGMKRASIANKFIFSGYKERFGYTISVYKLNL